MQASFYYYELAVVKSVAPSCGPLSGFTQLAIVGDKFVEYARDDFHCAFK
jgi:hypothetical protein